MKRYEIETTPDGPRVHVPLRGSAVLWHPMFNKGTAFTAEEREAFGLEGRLPAAITTIEQQAARFYEHLRTHAGDPLEQYIELAGLQDRNEHVFYRVLSDHLEEFLPVVYTPTVGEACRRYSHIFRRGRGLWITPGHRGRIAEVLAHSPFDDVRLIVVTDNERILGLGDQGAGGMGIPIGKLVLYTLAAGIHPSRTLPISLDVGTDNQALLHDDLYVGWRRPRLRGPEYDALVDEFVQAVKARWPKVILQWEDFKKQNAFTLLDRYRETLTCFNDDIQGTAAVAVAGILASERVTKRALAEERFLIVGAGAAGIGIARQLRAALAAAGVEGEALTRAIALVDTQGLLRADAPRREACKAEFTWPVALVERSGLGEDSGSLVAIARALKPTILMGATGQGGLFDEELIRTVAAGVEQPVVFPMSNPTRKAEAAPKNIVRWTEGRALIATGSPFPPCEWKGRTIQTGQGNNVYIFPGVGLGVLVSGAARVTDAMFIVAAETLAAMVAEDDLAEGRLYPPLSALPTVASRIAHAVACEAVRAGLAEPAGEDVLAERVAAATWSPTYPSLVPS